MKRAVVLLSGGLDSATTLYFAKDQGYKCSCLIFDYGQRHEKEIECARNIAKKADCRWRIEKIILSWKGSSLLDRKAKLPQDRQGTSKIPNTYVPARNIIFLSFATSFAEAQATDAIFIGANIQDYSGYPDCRPEFFKAYEKVISCGTKAGIEKREIKIHTPLIYKSKAEIIRLGLKLGVPFELTWSCYKGLKLPCGVCDSCYFRARGFKEAGVEDPLLR